MAVNKRRDIWCWQWHDDQWQWVQDNQLFQGNWHELQHVLVGQGVILVVDGRRVLALGLEIPGRYRHQRLKALPYVIEPYLDNNLDDNHWVSGQWQHDRTQVLVTACEQMDAWLAPFRQVDLWVKGIYADFQLLPRQDQQITQLILANRQLLASLTHQATLAQGIDFHNYQPWQGLTVNQLSNKTPLLDLWQQDCRFQAINLLTKPWQTSAQPVFKWTLPAILSVIALLLAASVLALQVNQLQRQVQGQHQAMVALYRQVVPNARRVPNPALQMEQQWQTITQRYQKAQRLWHWLKPLGQVQPLPNLQTLSFQNNRLTVVWPELNANQIKRLQQAFDPLNGADQVIWQTLPKGGYQLEITP